MRVVLLSDVKDLGQKGELKDVADGYARNYLIPRQLATPATAAQLNRLKLASAAEARRADKAQAEARTLAERVEGTEVTVAARVGEHGRLYGSVTNADIAERLSAAVGEPIDRRQVELPDPIRQSGSHQVKVRIARGVEATVTVNVVPEA